MDGGAALMSASGHTVSELLQHVAPEKSDRQETRTAKRQMSRFVRPTGLS
jgi:hypothetical protein